MDGKDVEDIVSASNKPTLYPLLLRKFAIINVNEVFPTPPFPEAIAIFSIDLKVNI